LGVAALLATFTDMLAMGHHRTASLAAAAAVAVVDRGGGEGATTGLAATASDVRA